MLGSAARRNISREKQTIRRSRAVETRGAQQQQRERDRETNRDRDRDSVCVCERERERGKKRKSESERESFVSARAIRSNVLHLTNDRNVITVLESA